MKRLLVAVLPAFLAAGGVFAQVTVSGGVQTDFGANVDMVDDGHTWFFDTKNSGTNIKLNAEADGVTAFVKFGAGGFNSADATLTFNSSELSIGYSELPWVQWSSVNFIGDNNYAFGASASDKNAYIQYGTGGFYVGISDASFINGASTESWKLPGFFIGYDFVKENSYSVGAAFACTLRGESEGEIIPIKDENDAGGIERVGVITSDGIFPFMVNAHAKILLDPLTIGVNVGIYSAPDNGFFTISDVISDGYGAGRIVHGDRATVLEAMLDFGIALDPCTIGVAGALVLNYADDTKGGGGQGLRIGASADFNIGGGFTFTPGVIFTTFLKGPGGSEIDYGTLAIGTTLSYSF
jgi:hypothetical protein